MQWLNSFLYPSRERKQGGAMKRLQVPLWLCALIFLLTGCAFDVVHVKQISTNLDSGQAPKNSCVLEKEANVDLGTGFSRTLRPGTRWDYAGSIPQGDVFKTKDQILTVEASHIHEAYIVVSSGKLVGFYLPVEKTFSPLSEPQELSMRILTP
jgi:hypothetical protein